MSKQIPPFGLRLPPEVKDELEKLAEKNRRSLNAEITVRLEENLAREKENCGTATLEELRQIVTDALESVANRNL